MNFSLRDGELYAWPHAALPRHRMVLPSVMAAWGKGGAGDIFSCHGRAVSWCLPYLCGWIEIQSYVAF